LNEFGIIACNEWKKLPERFPNFELDVFQVMPNHMHGIVVLTDATNAVKTNGNVGAGLAPAHDNTSNIDVGVGLAPTQNNTLNDDMGEGANPTVKREGASPAVKREGANPAVKRAGASPAPTVTVGNIIGAYKSLVANECLNIYKMKNKTMGKLWQRNFYEHIIRDERSYQTISNYIINNPSNWKDDKFFSE